MTPWQTPRGSVFDRLLNERTSIALSYGLVTAMLICAAVPFIELGQRLLPDWDGGYLMVGVGAFALEALLSWRAAARLPAPSREWLAYRLAELVVLVLGLRLYVYAHYGFNGFWADLRLWPTDRGNLLGGEFIFAMLLTGTAWGLATYFAAILAEMEGDEYLFGQERDVNISSDRGAARKRLISEIFVIGGAMLVVTAILRNNLAFLGLPAPSVDTGLINVVVYFVFSLIMLAQSQFAVLRARWGLDQIPAGQNLAPRWAGYGLALLGLCALLVIFLPTRYSVGFLDSLRFALAIAQFIIYLIVFLLWLPIGYLLSLLGLGLGRPIQPPPTIAPLAPAPAGGVLVTIPEILRSILFWAFLTGISGASIYAYFRQRADWLAALRRWPVLAWLLEVLERLSMRLGQVRDRAETILRSFGWQIGPGIQETPWSFVNLRRLSPREQIRFYYLALVRRAGVVRQKHQTPLEFQAHLAHLPTSDVSGLTDMFMEARYSDHPVSTRESGIARRFWENIRTALRRQRSASDAKRDP
jgi:hypothetical protein